MAQKRPRSVRFPRSAAYNPDWLMAGVSGGANPLWLTEWLTGAMGLRKGMKVLDLGCGRAVSSIFLRREFGVRVWAVDLWFSAAENKRRAKDAGAAGGVYPVRADARSLPFAAGFFDAIVSIDSFPYYGTDEMYLYYLARLLKPGGRLGIAGSGLTREVGSVPGHLRKWWDPLLWCLHSPNWWKLHWNKTGLVHVQTADIMPAGWKRWKEWIEAVAPENKTEIDALNADAGRHLGYVRVVARRRRDAVIADPIVSVPTKYARKPLLKSRAQ